jgi:hypothetical protein
VDDTLDESKDANFNTHIDLASTVFWQVRVCEEDIRKTTIFHTHDGPMKWVTRPLGLCIASATFQRMMSDIMRAILHDFVIIYLDDISVSTRTLEEHLKHLAPRLALKRFKEEGLKLRLI